MKPRENDSAPPVTFPPVHDRCHGRRVDDDDDNYFYYHHRRHQYEYHNE